MIDMDWAKLQVMTTIDYAHGSWLTTFLSGALNHQVVHHLFPNISQVQSLFSSLSSSRPSPALTKRITDALSRDRADRAEDVRGVRGALRGPALVLGGPQGPPPLPHGYGWRSRPPLNKETRSRVPLSVFVLSVSRGREERRRSKTFQFSRTVSKPRLRFVPGNRSGGAKVENSCEKNERQPQQIERVAK